MNCKDASEILDRMVFENIPMDAALGHHLDTCTSCSRVYREVLKARDFVDLVRRSEPLLANPDEITDNIMNAIRKPTQKKTPSSRLYLQRLLAAASVAACLLFGYEQYHVVIKVRALEAKFTEFRQNSRYSDPLRFASAVYLGKAGVSLSEIERRLTTGHGTTHHPFSCIVKRLAQNK